MPLVVRASVQLVQGIVGVALLIAAALYAMSNLNLFPIGGSAAALPIAGDVPSPSRCISCSGALMAFGIGLYAPSLILLSLLGLDPRLAFPIMASACAFLMPATGFSFVKSSRIDLRIVIGIAIGGIPATIVAALAGQGNADRVAALGRGRGRALCRVPAAALRHPGTQPVAAGGSL